MPRRFVLVCQGPNCKVQGSGEVRDQLRKTLKGTTPSGDIVVVPYQCFDRCGLGPNIVIYPDGVWYEGVEVADLDVIERHLAGGPIPARLLSDVGQEHAETYYRLIESILPELEAKEKKSEIRSRRRWWPF